MRRTRCQSDRGRACQARSCRRASMGRFRPWAACLGLTLTLASGLIGTSPGFEARAEPPGPEIFANNPKTPLELWEVVDYLVKTEQAPKAAPYLARFLATGPSDESLLQVRDRYGVGSILRLQDSPATRAAAEPLAQKLSEAIRRRSSNPERIARFVGLLAKTPEEQDYAVDGLRESGPYAVPAILKALAEPSLPADQRALMVKNLGRLDTPAVPPLIAALDAPEPGTAAAAADALGRLGDPRAVPALTAAALGPAAADARVAVERITGKPFDGQPKPPVRLLTDEARRYQTHKVKFPGDPVLVWVWDPSENAPVAKTVAQRAAERYLGLRHARAALGFDPTDRPAQVALLGLALERAIDGAGFDKFPAGDPSNTFATAVSAGPAVLAGVLRSAVADHKSELAAVAASALGQVADASAVIADGPGHPLVEALSSPDRRARFAAAKALVALNPGRPFAGSSRVVPTLAQFLASRGPSRAVVIDGNGGRGNMVASHLRALGYDTAVAQTGHDGFTAAAESADVELVLLDHHMTEGGWRLHDTLANLRADARTAGLPIYVYGPLNHHVDLGSIEERFPGVKLIVTPVTPEVLDQQLAVVGRPVPIPTAERAGYATEAAALLARIASTVGSPFEADLARVEPTLAVALNIPSTTSSTAAVLSDIPLPDAQRGLADALIDPSRPAPVRLGVAGDLARSVRKFGPLVAADQEAKLVSAFDREADPALRTALGTVIGTLRPKPAATGRRLRQLAPDVAPTTPTPVSVSVPVPVPVPGSAASPSPEASSANASPTSP